MTYPIIQIFKNDKNIYGERIGPPLATVSLLPIFSESIILDSDGKKYTVDFAEIIGWANFFGYHPLKKGRTAKIQYKFSEERLLSLEEFKDFLKQQLSKGVKKGFWYGEKEIPLLIEKIDNRESFQSVIECFIYDLTYGEV